MIGSFQTWRDLQTNGEKDIVLARWKRLVHLETVKALRDLYFLLDWEAENQIHLTFTNNKSIEETRAYVKGLEYAKRLLEPLIKPHEGG